MKKNRFFMFHLFIGLLLLIGLSACQQIPTNPLQSPLNSPGTFASPLTSLLATPVSQLSGPNFEMAPVKAGDTLVSGHGPYDLPVEIIDVTLSGLSVADGKIDGEGNFRVQLRAPAIANHILGIQIVDLTGTPFTATDEFVSELNNKAGPGFKYYPILGAVFASVVVSP
jgi:hypothetical protein